MYALFHGKVEWEGIHNNNFVINRTFRKIFEDSHKKYVKENFRQCRRNNLELENMKVMFKAMAVFDTISEGYL